MGRDPLAIVREYRSASDPAIRSKAVVALGVVAARKPWDAAVEDLVNTALYDPDREVREAAELVVREELPDAQRLAAVSVLDRRVDRVLGKSWKQAEREDLLEEMVANRLVQQRALALLVELRNRDSDIGWKQRRFRRQLDLAVAIRRRLPFPEVGEMWRMLIEALGNSVVATVLLVVILVGFRIPVSVSTLVVLSVASAVFATLFAFAVSWRATTTRTYLDRLAGAVVEIFGTMVNSLLPAAALVVVVMLAWPQGGQGSPTRIALLVLAAMSGILAYLGAIRLGDLLCGVGFPPRSRLKLRLPRAAVGWSAGTALLSLLFFVLKWPGLAEETATFAAGIGLLLLPVGISVAWTAAKAPVEEAAVNFWVRRCAPWAVIALLVAAPVLLVRMYFHPYRAASSTSQGVPLHEPLPRKWNHTRVPASEKFHVDFTQKVDTRVEPESERSPAEFVLRLRREGEKDPLVQEVAPPSIEDQVLQVGDYLLEADVRGSQRSAVELRDELFAVARLLARLDSADRPSLMVGQAVGPYSIILELNADPEFAMLTRVEERLADGRIEEAVGVLRRAESVLDKFEPSLELLDRICRLGALRGLQGKTPLFAKRAVPRRQPDAPLTATEALTVEFCNMAVERGGDNPAVNDSRAFVRILIGDWKGAIEDFERFVAWYGEAEESTRRRQWIKRLRLDRPPDPFFSTSEIAGLLADAGSRTLSRVAESSIVAHVEHLMSRLREGAFDNVVEELDLLRAQKSFFDEWGVWHSLCLYAAPRQASAALEFCRKALANDGLEAGSRALLLESRALALLQLQRLDEAGDALSSAVAATSAEEASPQTLRWLEAIGRGENPLEKPEVEEYLQATRSLPLAFKASILADQD